MIATVSPPTTTTSASTLLRDKMGDSGPVGCEFGDGGLQQLVPSSCLLSQRRACAPGTPLVNLARKKKCGLPLLTVTTKAIAIRKGGSAIPGLRSTVQVTLTREAVLDLPMYLSSCENSSIVLQVQGVFANALSVDSPASASAPFHVATSGIPSAVYAEYHPSIKGSRLRIRSVRRTEWVGLTAEPSVRAACKHLRQQPSLVNVWAALSGLPRCLSTPMSEHPRV